MARFTLVIFDSTHAVLATDEDLTMEQVTQIQHAFEVWKTEGGVAILADTDVVDRHKIELELDIDRTSPAEVRHERFLHEPQKTERADEDEDAYDAWVRSH